MSLDHEEEKLLRSVAQQNAQGVLLTRKRNEEELVRTKEALERKTEELVVQREWFQVALSSIGDAVVTTDTESKISFLNPTAESMTGWKWADAIGQPLETVFKIVNEHTRAPVENPITKVLREGIIVGLANHTALVSRDGRETAIEDSAAPIRDAKGNISGAVMVFHDVTDRRKVESALRDETRILELLNKTGSMITGELDLETLVQKVTDASTELTGARFGAFFYNVINRQGESFLLYALSGAPREAFAKFGMPRNTPVFGPTFRGEGVVRSGDITKDPRYGTMAPHHGMPKGHLPVCSYLAVPVISRSGETLGGLFFGHPEPDVFTERSERIIIGVAAQAAVAIDNARLYERAQKEIEERKRAEETVREGAERLQLALSAGHLGNWRWDAKTDLLTLADRAADIFGVPRNTPISRQEIRQLLHKEDSERARLIVEKAIEEHSAYTVEYRLNRPSGEQCWILAKGVGTYPANGSPTGLIGVVQDITEQKRAELERGRLTNVIEQSLNEVYMFDTETLFFTYVNEGARRNLGYSLEEMQKLTPLDLKPEFTEASFREMVKPLLSGEKEKLLFYTVHRRRDQTLYPVEVHLQAIAHDGQRVFVAIILDITERRQAEEARFRLASVVESSDDAIISKTLDGNITSWNEGAKRMYGYEPEEVIGKSVTILIPPNLLDEEPAIIERLRRGERIEHYETVRVRKDGTLLDVALTVSPLKNSDGKIIGASKIARDVTERKIAEKELRRAKDELEQRVQERTASLRETTEQLEAFCYTIAHDLRSPLRAQQSFAQALLEDYKSSLDARGQEYATRIMKSARRMDQLVNDLLIYSRLSRSNLKFEKVELDQIVKGIQGHLADEIRNQSAAISVAPLLPVMAYEPTLNLVLTNLILNALKFVKPSVLAKIHIWTEPKGDFVRLWVEDNGIGIDPEHQDKIFGVFERLHSMDRYPGTGIGLAIVHKGVERMGGRVGVESKSGEGSRFWIDLPKSESV